MKLLDIKPLALRGVHVLRFGRFRDARGFFCEPLRRSVLEASAAASFLHGVDFPQQNESFSAAGVVRGLHFQWNPYMGKLVRTLSGHMVDIVLDIRKGSPTYGEAILYDMPASPGADFSEWIWVPPGFAHGNFFPEPSLILYLCSGEYSPGCEAGISPRAADIDWTLCDGLLKKRFDEVLASTPIISPKDLQGLTVAAWDADTRSDIFVFASGPRPA